MGILSSFFDVVAGVSILAGRSSLLDTNLTTIAGRNFTVRGALGLSFLSVGFLNLWATSRKQRKIERLTKEAESEPQLFLVIYHVYDKDTGRLTYEDAVQITSKDENTAKGDALVMLEEGGLDDEKYEIFKVKPISQDYQKQLYGADTFNADDEKEWTIIVYEYTDGMNSYAEQSIERGVMTNEELQAFVEEENESYGGERTMSAYIRGYLTGDEWRTAQRLNLGAETFSAEREVYVLTFSDPMRNGKLVELPFLTYEEAQEYIEANIAPYNANKPFSQQIATRIIFPSEEYNAPAAVMRTYKGRKSPSISAKSVKVGTRKRGNDGKMWQVRSVTSRGKRTQRWFKD